MMPGRDGRAAGHRYSDCVPGLSGGDQRFRDDRGAADPAVAAALTAFADGAGSEHAALSALAGCRLLVPVVAVAAGQLPPDGGADGTSEASAHGAPGSQAGEKASDMAMPVIVGRDGRHALPAFTSLESLTMWQSAARPVPMPAASVWQSAVQESCAVVVDIAGPVPVTIEGARLAALAGGMPVPALHEDPDVWQLAATIAAEYAPGIRVRLSATGDGLDLTVELAPPADVAGQVPGQVASQIGEALSVQLADRARRGIAVVVQAGAAGKPDSGR